MGLFFLALCEKRLHHHLLLPEMCGKMTFAEARGAREEGNEGLKAPLAFAVALPYSFWGWLGFTLS